MATLLNDGSGDHLITFDPALELSIDLGGGTGPVSDLETVFGLATGISAEGWVVIEMVNGGAVTRYTLEGVTSIFDIAGNIVLGSSDVADTIVVGAGSAGDDRAGGFGDDRLDGRQAAGPVGLFGEAGNDIIYGSAADGNVLSGGSGDDAILGVTGFSGTITGSGGNDFLQGPGYMDGGEDNDTLVSLSSQSFVYGGDGNDRLFGPGFLGGDAGDDIIVVNGAEALQGQFVTDGAGSDIIYVGLAPLLAAAAQGATGSLLQIYRDSSSVWNAQTDTVRFEAASGDLIDHGISDAIVPGWSVHRFEFAPGGVASGIFVDLFFDTSQADFDVIEFGVTPPLTPDFPDSPPPPTTVLDFSTGPKGLVFDFDGNPATSPTSASGVIVRLDGGAGQIAASNGVSSVSTTVQNVLGIGSTEVTSVIGTEGNDDITSSTGQTVTLDGRGGNDRLSGGTVMLGGAGADVFAFDVTASTSGVTADGGAGEDTLEVAPTGGPISFTTATLSSIEKVHYTGLIGSGWLFLYDFRANQIGTELSSSTTWDWTSRHVTQFTMGNATTINMALFSFSASAMANVDVNFSDPVLGFSGFQVAGDDDAEHMVGSAIRDSLFGAGGADVMLAGAGADLLYGGAGADQMFGGDGNDRFLFYNGDVVAGETIDGGSGSNTLVIENTANTGVDITAALISSVGTIEFRTAPGAQNLYMTASQINGMAASLQWKSTATNTVNVHIDLGSVNWFSLASHTFDTWNDLNSRLIVNGDGDAETVIGSGRADDISGGGGIDTLSGEAGDDRLDGGAGGDILRGGDGADTIDGGAGGDEIYDGTDDNAADILRGGNGNDVIYSYSGADDIDGGEGFDGLFLDRHTLTAAQNVDFSSPTSTFVLTDGTRVTGIESVSFISGSGDDTVSIESGNIHGGAGNDVLRISGSSGFAELYGEDGNDVLSSETAAYMYGGAGGDQLTGSAFNDWLIGDAGNDTLIGGNGDDRYNVEESGDHIVETNGGGLEVVYATANYTLDAFVENGQLLVNADRLTGNDLDNNLQGNNAGLASILHGLDGNDTLSAGFSGSQLFGDEGNDILSHTGGNGTLAGGSGNDRLTGDGGFERLIGGSGNDQIHGSHIYSGDTAVYGGARADYDITAIVSSGQTIGYRIVHARNTAPTDDGTDLVYDVENFEFSDGTVLAGDILNVNHAPVVANAIANQSSPEDAAWSFAVPQNTFGDADGDTLILAATLGNGDALPNDWLSFGFDPVNGAYTFSGTPPLNFNGSLDVKVTASDGSLTASDVFTLTVTPVNDNPSAVADSGYATPFNTAITISAAALLANDGDADGDTLAIASVSSAANGTVALNGTNVVFTPNANFSGGASFSYTVSDGHGGTSAAQVSLNVQPGQPANTINGTGRADFIVGTAGSDTINALGGNDIVYGNGGGDTILGNGGNDIVYGGAGNDTMIGGAGNDIYGADDAGDVTTEAPNEGTDEVISTISWTLAANVENLTLLGPSAISGTGNALANAIAGNFRNNTLEGGAGADELAGAGGSDTFIFRPGFGKDRISDFDAKPSGGQDFIGLSGFGINAANFASHVAITDIGADTLIVIDGDQEAQTIRLVGVGNSSTVTAADFLFI